MNRWIALTALIGMIGITGCGDSKTGGTGGGAAGGTGGAGDSGAGGAGSTGGMVEVSGDIKMDTTWSADKTYLLKAHTFVEGATLTIEPGTTILGDTGSSLVITQTAKILAAGTKDKPIVFSSAKPAGTRKAGDWGGVVLLGKAPINVAGGTQKIEGFPASETRTGYGGTDAAHNCGTLKYVRSEFAGFQLAPDNELNSITLGGCGSATTVDYVQTLLGNDDGIEIFGGSVNVTHAVISQPDDDGLDTDFGWIGKAQWIIVQQNKLTGDKAFEWDNNNSAHDAEPRNNPQVWNVTLVGSGAGAGMAGKKQGAMHLRRGTAGTIGNGIVVNFADSVINVSNTSTVTQMMSGALAVKSSIFWNNAGAMSFSWPAETGMADDDMGFDEAMSIAAAANVNKEMDPMLGDVSTVTAPNFKPKAALTGGAEPPAGLDTTARYYGAIGENDWTAGWTAYPSN